MFKLIIALAFLAAAAAFMPTRVQRTARSVKISMINFYPSPNLIIMQQLPPQLRLTGTSKNGACHEERKY
jgi:hypothetical protein